jgi:2,3-bisphosphoglycerate-dependent phosphoglycerate mutase
MAEITLLRHGKSLWNELNLFTGWVDVPLHEDGIKEAQNAGEKIKNKKIDVVFTSTLIRAQMTATIALLKHDSKKVPILLKLDPKENSPHFADSETKTTLPVYCAHQLNERMYGELQGLNKDQTISRYGIEQVKLWRRSFSTRPPGGESLEDTLKRTLPYFNSEIVPYLEREQNVLIVAHGNSLRSIVMKIEQLNEKDILEKEIPTGVPFSYQYKKGQFLC